MLKPVDKERLEQIQAALKLLNLRFRVATISARMNTNKGNLSAYLNGRKPISDQFLRKFYEVFEEDLAIAAAKAEAKAAAKNAAKIAAGGLPSKSIPGLTIGETSAAGIPQTGSFASIPPGALDSIQRQLYFLSDTVNKLEQEQKTVVEALAIAGILPGSAEKENQEGAEPV